MRSATRSILAALLLLAATAPSIAAQDARELERRIDAALALRTEAAARLETYRHAQETAPRIFPETVAVLDGALRIVTTAEFLPMVRAAAADADVFLRTRAGTRRPAATTVLAVWTDSIRRREHGVIIAQRVNDREVGDENVMDNQAAISQVLENRVQSQLGANDRPAFLKWMGGALPLVSATKWQWRAVRLELVSSRAMIAHRCYSGDIAACRMTLGLTEVADPITQWYDSSARRAIVAAARKSARLEGRAAAPCLEGHDSACITLLRTSDALAEWANAPGSGPARMALVQEAFDTGGPGALERLAASADRPAAAIAAIADAPIDSVVRRWQRHAHDGGVESESATPIVALTAAGWILVMGGLSLRSPRWR